MYQEDWEAMQDVNNPLVRTYRILRTTISDILSEYAREKGWVYVPEGGFDSPGKHERRSVVFTAQNGITAEVSIMIEASCFDLNPDPKKSDVYHDLHVDLNFAVHLHDPAYGKEHGQAPVHGYGFSRPEIKIPANAPRPTRHLRRKIERILENVTHLVAKVDPKELHQPSWHNMIYDDSVLAGK